MHTQHNPSLFYRQNILLIMISKLLAIYPNNKLKFIFNSVSQSELVIIKEFTQLLGLPNFFHPTGNLLENPLHKKPLSRVN